VRVFRALSAKADLDAIAEYFGTRNVAATLAMLDRIVTAEDLLAIHPRIGHPGRAPGTREFVVSGTPFVLVYSVDGEMLTVLRVLHTQQQWPPV
jgi:toxin ParE1/3/4